MLKSECLYLLNYINKNSISGFFVEEILSIVSDFPPYYNIDENKVKDIIENLKSLGYILVKYNDGERVCVKTTEKGVMYIESVSDSKVDINYKKLFLYSFFASIIGSFIGCVLVNVLFILIGA